MMNKQEARLLLIFISFMLDSILTYFLPYSYSKQGMMIIPCFGLMVYTFINHFLKDREWIIYSMAVGLYYSVLYANFLLIYVLIYLIIAFLGRRYEKISSFTFFETLLFALIAICIQEWIIYVLMRLTGVTALSIFNYAVRRFLPTMLFNVLLFIPGYFGFKKYQEIAILKGYEC